MHLLGTMAKGEKTNTEKHEFQDEMALILVVNMGTSSHNNERKHATIFEDNHLVFFFAMHIGFGFVPSGVLCCLWTPFIFQIFPKPMGTHFQDWKKLPRKTPKFSPKAFILSNSGQLAIRFRASNFSFLEVENSPKGMTRRIFEFWGNKNLAWDVSVWKEENHWQCVTKNAWNKHSQI